MDYPEGFPEHLQPAVDAAIAEAEILVIDHLGKPEEWHGAILVSVRTVFFIFAEQACRAGSEGIWSGAKIRKELEAYLRRCATHYYKERLPRFAIQEVSENAELIILSIKKLPEWRELQKKLKEVAEGRFAVATVPKDQIAPTSVELLEQAPLAERMDRAAALLRISHEVLAMRMKIGRTTYFAVKKGGGRPTSRIKVDGYVNDVIRKYARPSESELK